MYIHKYICPYVHTYLHTFLHTNIPWIHKSVTRQQDVEQVIHMHKSMHKFLAHETILQDIFICHLYIIKNSSTEQNECVFRYPFSATSKFAYLFLRFVSLHGKLLIILIPEQNAPFWKHYRLATGLWKSSLFLVSMLWTDEFVWNFFYLSTV